MAENHYCDEHKLRIESSKSNCKNISDVKDEIDHLIWPAVNSRPKTSTIVTIIVLLAGILGGSFSLLYNQGQNTSEKVEILVTKTTDKIDALADGLRSDIRRIENQQMIMQGKLDAAKEAQK